MPGPSLDSSQLRIPDLTPAEERLTVAIEEIFRDYRAPAASSAAPDPTPPGEMHYANTTPWEQMTEEQRAAEAQRMNGTALALARVAIAEQLWNPHGAGELMLGYGHPDHEGYFATTMRMIAHQIRGRHALRAFGETIPDPLVEEERASREDRTNWGFMDHVFSYAPIYLTDRILRTDEERQAAAEFMSSRHPALLTTERQQFITETLLPRLIREQLVAEAEQDYLTQRVEAAVEAKAAEIPSDVSPEERQRLLAEAAQQAQTEAAEALQQMAPDIKAGITQDYVTTYREKNGQDWKVDISDPAFNQRVAAALMLTWEADRQRDGTTAHGELARTEERLREPLARAEQATGRLQLIEMLASGATLTAEQVEDLAAAYAQDRAERLAAVAAREYSEQNRESEDYSVAARDRIGAAAYEEVLQAETDRFLSMTADERLQALTVDPGIPGTVGKSVKGLLEELRDAGADAGAEFEQRQTALSPDITRDQELYAQHALPAEMEMVAVQLAGRELFSRGPFDNARIEFDQLSRLRIYERILTAMDPDAGSNYRARIDQFESLLARVGRSELEAQGFDLRDNDPYLGAVELADWRGRPAPQGQSRLDALSSGLQVMNSLADIYAELDRELRIAARDGMQAGQSEAELSQRYREKFEAAWARYYAVADQLRAVVAQTTARGLTTGLEAGDSGLDEQSRQALLVVIAEEKQAHAAELAQWQSQQTQVWQNDFIAPPAVELVDRALTDLPGLGIEPPAELASADFAGYRSRNADAYRTAREWYERLATALDPYRTLTAAVERIPRGTHEQLPSDYQDLVQSIETAAPDGSGGFYRFLTGERFRSGPAAEINRAYSQAGVVLERDFGIAAGSEQYLPLIAQYEEENQSYPLQQRVRAFAGRLREAFERLNSSGQ